MLGVIIGAVIGGAAVWYWRDKIGTNLDEKTRNLRLKAADTREAMENQTEEVLDRAKPQITGTLRAGKEAIKPSDSTPRANDPTGGTSRRAS